MLRSEYPNVAFVDPADCVAQYVLRNVSPQPSRQDGKNKLRIYASGDCSALQANLDRLKVNRRVWKFDVSQTTENGNNR